MRFILYLWFPIFVQGQQGFLFNVSLDPNERTNLIDQEEFALLQANIMERMKYHQQFEREPVGQVNYAAGVWSKAGAAVPWLDYDSPPDIIEVKREKANQTAPHIVFVMLDDVGWSDIGYSEGGSNWAGFATPRINELANHGIILSHHYTSWVCGPSRASFLTGRYANRLGFHNAPGGIPILPLDEVTIAQELQLKGYRTGLVGKWHLGFQQWGFTPLFRGFDVFYGYYGGSVGYYSKHNQATFLDFFDQFTHVTAVDELNEHLTLVLQDKVEHMMEKHVQNHPDMPLFLYYAMQNIHTGLMGGEEVFEAPVKYLEMCLLKDDILTTTTVTYEQYICALIIMMDEAIGRTACKLEEILNDRDYIMVVASDNGGWGQLPGSNYPHRGSKGSIVQGGIQNPAFVYGSMIPLEVRGTTFGGLLHLTDWMPTFLSMATNGNWTQPTNAYQVDGFDVSNSLKRIGSHHPRNEIFHNHDMDGGCMQIGYMKYINGTLGGPTQTEFFFTQNGELPLEVCSIDNISSTTIDGTTDVSVAPTVTMPTYQPIPTTFQTVPMPTYQPTPATVQTTPMPTPVPRPCTLFDIVFGVCLDGVAVDR